MSYLQIVLHNGNNINSIQSNLSQKNYFLRIFELQRYLRLLMNSILQ